MNALNSSTKSVVTKTLPELVTQSLGNYPKDVQVTLLAVRELIIAVAESDAQIGQLEEALRWGELSYLTEKPNTGSIVRLALTKSGEPAMFFHCGTSLVETFRAQYSHIFEFENNRALVLRMPIEETVAEISHCIRQALRYKLDGSMSLGPATNRSTSMSTGIRNVAAICTPIYAARSNDANATAPMIVEERSSIKYQSVKVQRLSRNAGA